MTVDERLDRLTARHEALTQSVEILTADVHALQGEMRTMQTEMRNGFQQVTQLVRDMAEGIDRLLNVAENHERRLTRLEGGE
jgi:predicted RNase H-like nuclease (RuvC/YqgF family)